MRPKAQPRFCKEGGGLKQKLFFFARKLFTGTLGPVMNKLMQLKRVKKQGAGGRDPIRWKIFMILRQNNLFFAAKSFFIFCDFAILTLY